MSAEQRLSASMVTALRRHGDDWRSTDRLSTWAVSELEQRGLVESELRDGFRYGRLTAAGVTYLARLEPTEAQRV